MNEKQRKQQQFQQAYLLLKNHENALYSQKTLCDKLQRIGCQVKPSLFSNMVNEKRYSYESLVRTVKGLNQIIAEELDMAYDQASNRYIASNTDGWYPVKSKAEKSIIEQTSDGLLFHYEGRRSISEKAVFISSAVEEVAFLGLRLRQFVGYFHTRKDAEFKDYIVNLLSRGVAIKCYALAPESNEAKLYFTDQARIFPDEKNGEQLIPRVLDQLLALQAELHESNPPGRLQIFTYKHIPHSHFIVVDGQRRSAKLLAASYLYGIKRSKIPVVEVYRQANAKVYELYWKSFQQLVKNAKEIKQTNDS